MKESLNKITIAIDHYENDDDANPFDLVEYLRVISTHLFRLEVIRCQYRERFEKIRFEQISEGNSAAKATNYAEVKVPELYMLRHIIGQANRVCDSIRTHVSLLKSENINSVNQT